MAQEVELKLELDRRGAKTLAGQALRERNGGSKRQTSVYYDGAGDKLRKNGLTLRVRETGTGFVQTVKALDDGAGLFSRGEWEAPVGSIEPHVEQLRQTPAGNVPVRKLRPIIRSQVERTTWRACEGDSILEFALDVGKLRADRGEAPVCELEIEVVEGDAAAVFNAARDVAEQVPVSIGVLSKAERGFALADDTLAKVAKAGPVPVRPDMNVADAFSLIAQSCIRHFRLNEPLVVRQRDPEALHQLRVAMRRLRAALSIFRPALEDARFEPLRDELRWFTFQLGGARNLDVYLARKRLPRDIRKALKQERKLAYDRVIETLQSKRSSLLMIDLVEWISLGDWRVSEKARRPLPDYAARRIGRLWRKIASHGELEPMHGDERHELRIEVKKLRYALEFVEPLNTGVGRRRKQFTRAIEAVQEALGILNDMVTAEAIATMVGDDRELARLHSSELHRKCVREAQSCLDQLRKIGPYWSKSGKRARSSSGTDESLSLPTKTPT